MGRKNRSIFFLLQDCMLVGDDDHTKFVRDNAKRKIREWLRIKDDERKEMRKIIATQRGMTTKQIQTARRDWVRFGRKVLWPQFLQTRRVELDRNGSLMIHGASRA